MENKQKYGDHVIKFIQFLKTTTVNVLLHATVSALDYTPNVVSKRCFFFIFKHSWAPKRSWKISHGRLGKVLDFFAVKEWEPWAQICTRQVYYFVALDMLFNIS